MNKQELKQMAEEVHDVVYGGVMNTEHVVARVTNYVLKKEEEVKKETAKKIYDKIDAFADKCIIEGDAFRDIATDFDFVKFFKWLDSFFKEFGVEVEE